MKIAFDTNVLIYACDTSDPQRQATALDLIERPGSAVILWQVACEFVAASRKLVAKGLTPLDAWEHLQRFLAAFPLVLPARAVLDRARSLHLDQQWSYWDALLVAASMEAGVTRLYSEDLPGREPPPGLQIVNPFA